MELLHPKLKACCLFPQIEIPSSISYYCTLVTIRSDARGASPNYSLIAV